MAYTQADLDSIRQAKIDFGLGKRVGQRTIGEFTVRYAEVSLTDIERIEATIASQVNTATVRGSRSFAKNMGRG